jgi:hypothetical protein
VIQLLLKEKTDFVSFNVAGEPGVRFRVLYSTTGKEGSYTPAPEGQGLIGPNGSGSVGVKLGPLAKSDIYLLVKTSDKADFADTRTMAEPFVLELSPIVEEKSFNKGLAMGGEDKKDERSTAEKVVDKVEAKIKEVKATIESKMDSKNRVSAVAGVRG